MFVWPTTLPAPVQGLLGIAPSSTAAVSDTPVAPPPRDFQAEAKAKTDISLGGSRPVEKVVVPAAKGGKGKKRKRR